jgi:hypothetical protein
LLDQPLVAEYSPATDDEFRRDVAHVPRTRSSVEPSV